MTDTISELRVTFTEARLRAARQATPLHRGHSKTVYDLDGDHCLVELVPSLSSFTHQRFELVRGTDRLRLDFYEKAAARLERHGVPCAFRYRVDERSYVARYCAAPPVEVIVKHFATGSTLRKYPGLFEPGHPFREPVVKFDYRIDPEDQPIADDYVRELGADVAALRSTALAVDAALVAWLAPLTVVDFCVIIGPDNRGDLHVNSEISPDCMRIKDPGGASLDKDLFRAGRDGTHIVAAWSELVAGLD